VVFTLTCVWALNLTAAQTIIYTPSTNVEFSGGASANSSSIVIIADMVEFKGGDTFLGDFDNSSILNNALMLRAKLVE
jgi:hypothetical protein